MRDLIHMLAGTGLGLNEMRIRPEHVSFPVPDIVAFRQELERQGYACVRHSEPVVTSPAFMQKRNHNVEITTEDVPPHFAYLTDSQALLGHVLHNAFSDSSKFDLIPQFGVSTTSTKAIMIRHRETSTHFQFLWREQNFFGV